MIDRDRHIVDALRRWIRGDIDREGEIRLDRQASDDPFLREALEGYRHFTDGPHEERLNALRDKLEGSPQGSKKGAILVSFPYRIAAAAAMLVLAVGLFWWLAPAGQQEMAESRSIERTVSEREAADVSETPTEVIAEAEEQAAANDLNLVPEPAPGPELAPMRTSSDNTSREENPIDQGPTADQPAEAASEDRIANNVPPVALRSREADAITEDAADAPAPPSPLTARKASGGDSESREVLSGEAGAVRVVTGQVLDERGSPLSGVSVVKPGERSGAITNQDGQYEIALDSNVRRLEFQRTGFEQQEIDLPKSTDFFRTTLSEAAQSDAVSAAAEASSPAVTGKGPSSQLAQPKGGFRRFNRFLERNLQYPREAIEQRISGEVTLQFTVLPDGTLANIEVMNTPGGGLEEEARRLLTNGPEWRITSDSPGGVRYVYSFNFFFE